MEDEQVCDQCLQPLRCLDKPKGACAECGFYCTADGLKLFVEWEDWKGRKMDRYVSRGSLAFMDTAPDCVKWAIHATNPEIDQFHTVSEFIHGAFSQRLETLTEDAKQLADPPTAADIWRWKQSNSFQLHAFANAPEAQALFDKRNQEDTKLLALVKSATDFYYDHYTQMLFFVAHAALARSRSIPRPSRQELLSAANQLDRDTLFISNPPPPPGFKMRLDRAKELCAELYSSANKTN
jgi:hypothetical protein